MDEDGTYDDDDFADHDDPWPEDDFDDDCSDDLVECPHCGADIFEDSVQCPVCGDYVTFGTNVWSGRSLIWIVLGLLGIVATIWVLTVS